ncbi:very short patch repair endonuclease [Paenibacillus ehimensis]|uniref:very short patch repair endonuclease n=1 Tax=Paenibacillus ehimensis TaxID=79264 RepID=UPI000FD72E37|nr:very short patch repair endonuclease [Paenibacillus ehimensis]
MADKISKERRSKNMQAIRSISKLETIVSKALWNRGYRFRRNVKGMIGKPDIVIKKYKIVVFIDSCFWHGCKEHGHIPKSNSDYWAEKIEKNIMRDNMVTSFYKDAGWNIIRFWEHQIKQDLSIVIETITNLIENERIKQKNEQL